MICTEKSHRFGNRVPFIPMKNNIPSAWHLETGLHPKNIFAVGILSLSIGLFLYNLLYEGTGNVEIATTSSVRQYVTVIVAVAGLFSAVGAMVFSGLSQSSHNKNQYYQILKDFESDYTRLVEIEAQLKDYVWMAFEDLSRQPREVIEDVELYRWKFFQFHERLSHLALRGIIPKEIARYYALSFGVDLAYIDIDFDPDLLKKELGYTIAWCRSEGITKTKRS